MLVGLSLNTGPPIKFKSVAISSTCLNLSTLLDRHALPTTALGDVEMRSFGSTRR
jgi:hypothetical protein